MLIRNLLISVLIFFAFYAKSQAPAPSGFPAPYSIGYYRIGWLQADSGSISAYRDTNWIPKFQGTEIVWLHAGVDTSKWIRIGSKWVKELNALNSKIGLESLSATLPIVYNNSTGNFSCPTCAVGGGIASLNGLTVTTQTFSTGTSGTDFGINSVGSVHTFNFPTASASNRGLLSTSDWSLFNSKQSQLNGTGFVKAIGTSISYDNTSYYPSSNPNNYISPTSLSALSPLSYNNITGVFSADTTTGATHLATQGFVTRNLGTSITGSGNLSPLFTTSIVSNTLVFSASNSAANSIFGNNTGSPAASTFFVPTASTINNWQGFAPNRSVKTIANLYSFNTSGLNDSSVVIVTDTVAGGSMMWVSTSTTVEDSGTVFKPTAISSGSPGRWFRQYSGPKSVRFWGIIGDNATNVTRRTQLAMNSCVGGALYFPSGIYLIDSLIYPAQLSMRGESRRNTRLQATASSVQSFIRLGPGQSNEIYLVDISITSNGANTGQNGFDFTAVPGSTTGGLWNFEMDRVDITNFKGMGINLACSDGAFDMAHQFLTFRQIRVFCTSDTSSHAVVWRGQVNQTTFDDCEFDGPTPSVAGTIGVLLVSLGSSNDQIVGGNTFHNISIQGFDKAVYTYNAQGVAFTNDYFESDSVAIHATTSSRITVSDIHLSNVGNTRYVFGNDNSVMDILGYRLTPNPITGKFYTSPSGTPGGGVIERGVGQTTNGVTTVFVGQNINVSSNTLNTGYFRDIVTNVTTSKASFVNTITSSLSPGDEITIRALDTSGSIGRFLQFRQQSGNIALPYGLDSGALILRNGQSAIFKRSDLVNFWSLVSVSKPEIYANNVPTTGTWFPGEVVYNNVPVFGTAALWICKVGGTPGTWDSVTIGGGGGGGGGTVTSVSSGNLSPLFTVNVANPTTTPAFAFTLSNAAANTAFGNFTGSSAAPSFGKLSLGAIATGTPNDIIGRDGSGNAIDIQPDSLFQVDRLPGVGVQIGNLSNDTLYLDRIVAGANIALTKNPDSTVTIAGAQSLLTSGNGTTYVPSKVNAGGIVTANMNYIGSNAYTAYYKTNVRIGDSLGRIGLLFNDNFARSSLGANYGTAGTQTISFPSSAYLQIAGGLDYNNNVYRLPKNGYNRFVDTVRFVATVLNSSSYGLDINYLDSTNYATGFRVQFGTATGGLTNIYLRYYNGTQIGPAGSFALTMTAGDSLLAVVRKVDNTLIMTYKNLTVGGSDSSTLTYTSPTVTIGNELQATGYHAIGCLGGTINVSYWSVYSDECKRMPSVIGDSRYSTGHDASSLATAVPGSLFPFRDLYVKMGGSGDRSSDALSYLAQLDSVAPPYVLYNLGINDATNAVALATYSANVVAFVTHEQAKGVGVIFVELPPNNSAATKIYSDTLRAIAARYSIPMVNGIYDALRTGTSYNAIYSTDGTHENDAGYAIEVALIRAQAPQLFNAYNLFTLNLPRYTGGEFLDVIDGNGGHRIGIPHDSVQQIGTPFRSGPAVVLPNNAVPAVAAISASNNSFNQFWWNTDAAGWSGPAIYNSAGIIRGGLGWNNGSAGGIGADHDSALIFKTFGVKGKFRFYAGNNSAFANPPEENIDSGAVIFGSITNKKNALLQNYLDTWLGGKLILHTPSSGLATDSVLVWRPADSVVREIAVSALVSGGSVNIYNTDGTLTGNRTLDGSASNFFLKMGNGTGNRLGSFQVYTVNDVVLNSSSGYTSISGGTKYHFITSGDVSFTADNSYYFTKLSVVTANRTITLPTPAAGTTGQVLVFVNTNTSGTFTWSFGSAIVDAAGNSITNLVNGTTYQLVCDGTNWIKYN